jgi:chemotaxis protein methyltransferase CheR
MLRDLVQRESWIHLTDSKHTLLENRLSRRLRTLGMPDFEDYLRLLESHEASDEIVHLLDAVSTNETRFFRELRHFALLEDSLLATWAAEADRGERERVLRVWSAGCATGEEPASLAMVILARFPPGSGWTVDVLATDLSSRALETARAGRYPLARAKEIPPRHLTAFMLRGTGEQRQWMKVGPEVRGVVRFLRHNLARDPYPAGRFDLIFCRNVLIYLDGAAQLEVVRRFLGCLGASGLLFLGHAETLADVRGLECSCVAPAVYTRKPRARRSGRGA